MFKIFILTIGVLSFLSASSELNWNSSYEKALKEAKAQNKDIYMLIVSSDCRWCRKFESTTLQDSEVIKRLEKKYILLEVNKDKDFIDPRFNTKSVPRHYFIREDEKIIHNFLGAWNRSDFYSFLKDVDKKRELILKTKENR
ncbi:MAG: DUF255 domain-containing protein [Campylobacterota bacterium]|nr:DUF255 domain-containing protein [Campylobacterota bacterium]